MVKRVFQEGVAVARVAQQFGVSRHTVYKWIRRYDAAGYRTDPAARDGTAIGSARTGWI